VPKTCAPVWSPPSRAWRWWLCSWCWCIAWPAWWRCWPCQLYALFNLAIYALIPVTLTLPGIAGFILSLGMAVDANVLIFERIKEELREGNTLIRSIDTGFSLAFSSILDGQLTTLISCMRPVPAWAPVFVKGFAVTLGIGVILSLFSALTCTRTLLRLLMSYPALRRPSYFLPRPSCPRPFPEPVF
jgi:preprotein translocase subunit SecD